ncbi:MAG: class I SAM-dependent methyltransferase [Bacteroidetes bacterium]|nr:class I SAM-dependent methyltransferase [Bacteroidota bacterium]
MEPKIPVWQSPSEVYSWFRMKRTIRNFFMEEIRSKKEIKVLDLGCGHGTDIFMLNLLTKDRNVEFIGVDISEKLAEYNNFLASEYGFKNCKFIKADIEQGLELGKYDVVISSEVLEHLHNLEKYLSNIKASLKESGAAIISTPNKSNFFRTVFRKFPTKARENIYKQNLWMEERNAKKFQEAEFHPSYIEAGRLRKMIEDSGLKIEKWQRGTLVYGGEWLDRHPFLFSCTIFLDSCLPKSMINLCWDTVLKARKVNKS